MPSEKPALFLASFSLLFGGIFLITQNGSAVAERLAAVNLFDTFAAPSAEALALDAEGYPPASEGKLLAAATTEPSFFDRVAQSFNNLRNRLTAQVVGDIAPTAPAGGFSPYIGGNSTIYTYPVITKGSGSTYTFTLRAQNIYQAPEAVNGITILYMVDGAPVSPRISSAPYTFTWDSSGTADGPHIVGFVITEGTNVNKYKPEGSILTVDNIAGVNTGPQLLPALGSAYLEARPRTTLADWISYSGGYTRQHNPGNTYPYRYSPPVHSLGIDPTSVIPSNKWFVEPITSVETDLHDQVPSIYRSKAGHLGVGYLLDQIGSDVKTSKDMLLTNDNIDGPRNNNNVSPYTTYAPNPEGPGWIGIDIAGRIFKINTDGSVVTIAGRKTKRDVVPYYTRDSSVSEAERQALQVEYIGNFEGGIKFDGPADLAFDPRNPKILYVADTYNARIAKVDFSSATPQITTYAGAPDAQGNTDGSARTARFKEPMSIAVAPDGRIFVADPGNDNIRVIAPDGGNVTTLATSVDDGLRDPFVVRLDSTGTIILGELSTGSVKSVHPTTGATALIKAGVCPSSWVWLDVDRKGNIGPKDDILHSCSSGIAHNNETRRMARDGSRMVQRGFESTWVLDFGRADLSQEPQLHYPWALTIDDEESRLIVSGFGNSAPHVYRLAVPSDPTPQHLYTQYMDGESVFRAGTVGGFPMGDRTSFLTLRSSGGMSHIPGIKSFDEMAAMSDAALTAYIQGGMGGSIPRPEITGIHLELLKHFIRLNSLRAVTESFRLPSHIFWEGGGYVNSNDRTKPIISNVRVELIDGATARVTWNTNEPTIGYVPFGISRSYHRWSKIESGYSTTHSVTLEHLPANTTVYYAVRSKDEAGNQTLTAPFTFQSGTPPGGIPPVPAPVPVPAPAPVPAPVPVPVPVPPPAPVPVPTPVPAPVPPSASVPAVLAGDVKAVVSGLWSNPSTWSSGSVPTGAQKVQISGVTVEYDVSTNASQAAEAKSIVISDGGKLNFSRSKSTRLDLDGSLMVLNGGVLEVGTQANPIPASVNVYIGLNVPNDRTFRTSTDPAPIAAEPDFRPEDVGIWVTGGGRMDINGAPKPKVWSKLALTTGAGNSTATLVDTPTGWRVGDKVIITPTGKNPDEVEIRTIASISGKTLTFTAPLTYKHEAAYYTRDAATGALTAVTAAQIPSGGDKVVSIQGEVGLLTQNVTIASNQVTASDTNHRSHTFYLKNTSGSLSYAEFRDMGARGKLGRYPVHLHLTGATVLNFPIIGLSIWNQYEPGNKWIVLHTTQKATVRGNVGYNAQGRGFYMETADEISNTMENNLGVRVTGPEEIPNTIPAVAELQQATRPGVFWVRAGNIVRGNVAVGGLDDVGGYWFTPSQLSDIPSTTFTNNEARANHFGFYFSGGGRMNYTVSDGLVVRNKVALWTDDLESPATISDTLLVENEGAGVRFTNLLRNTTILSLTDVAPPTGNGTIRDLKVTGDFALVKTCAGILMVRQTCTVSVVFKPTAPGLRTGTLSYFDTIAGVTKTIALRGFSVDQTTAPTPPPAPQPQPMPPSPSPVPAPSPSPAPPSTPTAGLVGHYTFDNADMSGTAVTDKSGTGNNGTLVNGPISATGKLGEALLFDGNDYVNLNAAMVNAQQDVTLAAWVYPTSVGNYPAIIAKTNEWVELGSEYVLGMYKNTGRPEFIMRGSITTSSNPLPLNQWSHVAVVNSATSCRIYVNGVLDTTCSAKPSPPSTADTWKIGTYVNGAGQFKGSIDDVRIYNRALSADEISALHNSGAQSLVRPENRFSVKASLRSLTAIVLAPFTKIFEMAVHILPVFNSKQATALVLDVSATSIDFGSIPVGQISSEQVITFTLNDTTPSLAAPTCSFSASPASVHNSGDSSQLTWSTQNASSVSINEGVGSVSTSGSRNVTVTGTKSFTLSATGSGGSITCSTSVTVHNPQDDHSSHDSGAPSGGGGGGGGGGRARNRTTPTPSPVPPTVTSPAFITQRTFVRGTTSGDMRTVQQILNRDPATRITSMGDGAPGFETGYFGALTEDAIKRFQIKYGIVSGGTPGTTGFGALGPRTLAKLIEVGGGVPFTTTPAPSFTPTPTFVPSVGGALFTSRLSTGSTGTQVSLLQRYLATDATLYPEGLVTGYYGPATQRAVERFQARFGIVTSGTPATTGFGAVGPATQSRLNQIYRGVPLAPVPQAAPISQFLPEPVPTPVLSPTPTPMPKPQSTAPAVPTTSSGGVLFTRTLKLGDTGTDVSTLQKMLAKDATVYPEGTVSGTFTPLTELAVRRFQRLYGIVSSGDASTTGYGAVGPRTQAKLLEVFGRP